MRGGIAYEYYIEKRRLQSLENLKRKKEKKRPSELVGEFVGKFTRRDSGTVEL